MSAGRGWRRQSGTVAIRLDPKVLAKFRAAAKRRKVSVEALIVEVLAANVPDA